LVKVVGPGFDLVDPELRCELFTDKTKCADLIVLAPLDEVSICAADKGGSGIDKFKPIPSDARDEFVDRNDERCRTVYFKDSGRRRVDAEAVDFSGRTTRKSWSIDVRDPTPPSGPAVVPGTAIAPKPADASQK
jgi:hypothetical protein